MSVCARARAFPSCVGSGRKEVLWVLKDPSPVLSLHGSVSQVLSQEQASVGPDLSPLETSMDQKV